MRIPGLLAIIIFILSLLIDTYIFLDIKKSFPRRKGWQTGYLVSAIACWIFLGICIFMPRRDAEQGISFQMWGLYAYLTIYIPKIIFTLFSLIGQIPKIWKRDGFPLGKWVGFPLAIISFAALWWGALITRNEMEVVRVEICSPRLPQGFNDYKIVQISDLHTGTWGDDTRFINRLVDSVNSLKPDVIFFTGDIVNRQTNELLPFLKSLSRLHAPDGVWSILGNHDYGDYIEWQNEAEKSANLSLLKNWQRQIGWKMLNNESTELIHNGDTIQLIGVENWGEPPFHQYGHLIEAYPVDKNSNKNLNDSHFKLLLTHNPEHWRREVTDISNIDLTLSGHTHAMQTEFRIGKWKWSPAVFRYPLWGGLYIKENPRGELMQLYINIGAGEVGMPFRIGAVPEITLITLRKGSIPYSLQPK